MIAIALAGVALAVGTAVQAPSLAQDSPWLPFVGCWEDETASRRDPITCVLPVEGDPLAADVVVLREGKEVRRSRLRADGTVAAIESADCEGRESSRFSLDATRVYLQGEVSCAGGSATRTVSLLAISPEARLIHISGGDTEVDPNVAVRALRGVPWTRLPKAVRADLGDLEGSVFAQRTAVSRVPLSTAAVVETSRSMGAPVSEIWLAAVAADSREWTPFDQPARAELVAGGVPSRVIAVLAALDNPEESAVVLSENGARVMTREEWTSQLELQRALMRVAQASSGAGSTSLGGAAGTSLSSAGPCSFLAGIFFGSGGFGGAAGLSAQGARQMMLAGCKNIARGDPRLFNVVYGAYPGSTSGQRGTPRPSTAPEGLPRPEVVPIGGLGGRSGRGAAAAGPRSTPAPSGGSGSSGGGGLPAPVRTP
jgi:hypothetical protein